MKDQVQILLVEDSHTQAVYLKNLLAEKGFAVRIEKNGQTALESIEKAPTDLIISDIHMPVMDGFTLCRKVKESDTTQNIPFFLVTSFSDAKDLIKAIESGADYLLRRPFETTALLGRIQHALENRPYQCHKKETADQNLTFFFNGREFSVKSHPTQLINLLISTFETAVHQNTLLSSSNEQLVQAQKKAEEANDAKRLFLAHMSHEIRTPLNAVIGYAELLLDTHLDDMQHTYTQHINHSGQILLGLINDILDFSKIEAGKLMLAPVKTDMIELLHNTIRILQFQAEKKGLALLLQPCPELPRYAETDPTRLQQILINLLSNGIKFTEKGSVELEVEFEPIDKKQGMYSFHARDTGIGITEEQKKRLFQAFEQAETSITRQYGGTGLGLFISNYLAELMGGGISLESKIGEGSCFSLNITLPYVYGDINETVSEVVFSSLVCDQKVPIVILVVDDSKMNLHLLKSQINRILPHAKTLEAVNGQEAVESFKANEIDLVFMDVQMPVMDGVEATSIIRAQEQESGQKKHTPIIALTAGATKEERERCLQSGMDDFMSKPFKHEQLQELIIQYTQAKRSKTDSTETIPKTGIDEDQEELHFDKDTFLSRIDYNQAIYKKMLSFSDDLRNRVKSLGNRIHHRKKEEIKSLVHGIKGIAQTMAFNRLGKIAETMEKDINEEKPNLFELYRKMVEEWDHLERIIADEMKATDQEVIE